VGDAQDTEDLDLASVTTREELAMRLRIVHRRADSPSPRTLEARTRHDTTALTKTVLYEMLKGKRFPRKAVLIAFLRVCGVQDDQMDAWRRAWERIAANEPGPSQRRTTDAEPSQNAARVPQAWSVSTGRRSGLPSAAENVETANLHGQISQTSAQNNRLGQDLAAIGREAAERQSIWHFPDGSRIILVSYRLPPDRRPPSADRADLNYVRYADLADLDTLIDIHGAIRAHNPASKVVIMAAQDLTQQDIANHIVLIGGLTWDNVNSWFSRIYPVLPVQPGDPWDRGAIVVHDTDDRELEFKYTVIDNKLVEDVGFFVRGQNPAAPRRTVTICGGITTRGVHGAARCFIDLAMREPNEQYLAQRFPEGSTYCIVMRVPVVNQDSLTPDLSKQENRLFEWCDTSHAGD
jgi:hypothetical protein